MMKAAWVSGIHALWKVKDVPLPDLAPRQVLIKVRASGLCRKKREMFYEESCGKKVLFRFARNLRLS